MGDALTRRMPGGRSVRITASVVTLASLLPLMLVQLAGTGQLMGFILGFSGESMQTGCIVGVGALMISYAAIGGMKGTALIQILKIVLLLGSGLVVAALMLHRFDWNPGALFDAAAAGSGTGDAFLASGLQFAGSASPGIDMISSHLTVVLGGTCLPPHHHAHVHRGQRPSGTPLDVLGGVRRSARPPCSGGPPSPGPTRGATPPICSARARCSARRCPPRRPSCSPPSPRRSS
ncbi:hypothetical protein STREPTOSP366_26450 [Streptomyces variabilis]